MLISRTLSAVLFPGRLRCSSSLCSSPPYNAVLRGQSPAGPPPYTPGPSPGERESGFTDAVPIMAVNGSPNSDEKPEMPDNGAPFDPLKLRPFPVCIA